jgi:hypothetical protein
MLWEYSGDLVEYQWITLTSWLKIGGRKHRKWEYTGYRTNDDLVGGPTYLLFNHRNGMMIPNDVSIFQGVETTNQK